MSEQLLEPPVVQEPTPPASNPELERLRAHNFELVGEKRRVQEQLTSLQQELQQLRDERANAQTSQLADNGEWKTLWEQAQETNATLQERIRTLEADLATALQEKEVESLQGQVLQAFARDIVDPRQLFRLEKDNFKLKDGKPVVLNGGVEQTLEEYLEFVKSPGSGYEHHCLPRGVAGMGAGGASAPVVAGSSNPYVTRNLTQIVQLELDNPTLADRLKREAGG
jgi:hypothetical protein